jgi:hypothetical protein
LASDAVVASSFASQLIAQLMIHTAHLLRSCGPGSPLRRAALTSVTQYGGTVKLHNQVYIHHFGGYRLYLRKLWSRCLQRAIDADILGTSPYVGGLFQRW